MTRPLRVVQVSFHADVRRRSGDALLRAWPTLPAVAVSAARAGVDVTVVQAAHTTESIERDGVTFHFVDDAHAPPLRLPGGVSLERRPARILERVHALTPDVVHVHGLERPLAARRLARA